MWCLHVRAHGLPVGELPDGAHPPALFLQPPHATEASSQWAPVSAALHETFPEFLLQIPTELPERVDELELGHLEEGLWFGLGCQETLPVSQIGIFVVVVVVVQRVVDVVLVVIPCRSVNAQHPGRQLSKQEKGAKEEGSVAQS